MNKKLIASSISSVSTILLILPIIALAAINPGPTPIQQNLGITPIINIILGIIWPIFFGFAVIMFIVAGFLFLTARGDATKAVEARQAIIWGAVGVVVGIIAFSIPIVIRNSLGL